MTDNFILLVSYAIIVGLPLAVAVVLFIITERFFKIWNKK